MIDLNEQELELTYPCEWSYKIFILKQFDAKKIAIDVLKQREHTLRQSKVSSKGKFVSYNISLIIISHDDRKNLYNMFGEHINVKMVM